MCKDERIEFRTEIDSNGGEISKKLKTINNGVEMAYKLFHVEQFQEIEGQKLSRSARSENVRNEAITNLDDASTASECSAWNIESTRKLVADYEKRIGGLPLFITLRMGSPQTITLGVLMGVAAGQRCTYMSSPADFAFGPLSRFLTRYSAVVWDDTKAVADVGKFLKITPASDRQPWFEQTCWVRFAPNGRQQLVAAR